MEMINNIRKLRKEQGLTLKRLSELTGLAPSLISQYENGDRHPKIENWQKLADYFGVSVEYLQGKTFINKRPDKEKMTMETNQKLRQQFENFVAEFKRFENIVFIDWHNANGSGNCRVNYMINEKTGELHISGDLGSAVFYWYGKNTWQNIASYSKSLGYFLSKAEANSEEGYYDETKARKELEEYFSEENWDNRDIEEELGCTRSELIDRAMERWNQYGTGEFSNEVFDEDRTVEFLHDNDIYSAGHTVSARERLWAVGLQMILEKYNNANN